MQASEQLNVLIVDDHELVRTGMRLVLESNPAVVHIAEANSGEDALRLATESAFDIILLDINLPGMSGLDAAEALLTQSAQSRIIVITGHVEAGHIRRLLNAGIRGYITKGSNADELEKAVSRVLQGEQYLSPDVAQQLAMDAINGQGENPFDTLTTRETEIINRLLKGQRNREISVNLHISEKTVSTHRTRAFGKLGVASPTDLMRLAMRFGLCS